MRCQVSTRTESHGVSHDAAAVFGHEKSTKIKVASHNFAQLRPSPPANKNHVGRQHLGLLHLLHTRSHGLSGALTGSHRLGPPVLAFSSFLSLALSISLSLSLSLPILLFPLRLDARAPPAPRVFAATLWSSSVSLRPSDMAHALAMFPAR